MDISTHRIRPLTNRQPNSDGDYVLYWMTSYRRGQWNFSLQRAVDWAQRLNKPLVVLEALRCGYRWANDRLHWFMLEGMRDNAAFFQRKPVLYYPYVEPTAGAGQGLLEALANTACLVVSDDFPCYFLPRMVSAAAKRLKVPMEVVDSNGLLPMRVADKVFLRAVDFRRFLQKNLAEHLEAMPDADPLAGSRLKKLDRLPPQITQQWPVANVDRLNQGTLLAQLPLDHSVRPSPIGGGRKRALRTLRTFVEGKLKHYATDRNDPQRDVASGLSPYLHAGHISAHEVFATVAASDSWRLSKLAQRATGSAQGWWGASEAVESFLDELITWRELGLNMCWQRDDYDQFESLPQWCQDTLAEHAADPRPYVYGLEELEQARTHDLLWNAAQRQLVREGRIHNYLRMLWGKKVLEWSPSPRDALAALIELNNKYALDGRDPNSYSGIFWCLGRYDRAWGPERPIFGKIRYMSSENTARKVHVKTYLAQYAPEDSSSHHFARSSR